MSTVAPPPPTKTTMTVEEFLALPDDGQERWLIRGELRPRVPRLSVRNRKHGDVVSRVCQLLQNWNDQTAEPRGKLPGGDTGFRLRPGDKTSLVGIDIAYASSELIAATPDKLAYYDGPPVLAVEVLSPSDTHEETVEKINECLDAGATVWQVDPDLRTVHVYRPGQQPLMFNAAQEIVGDPELPGFRAPVARFFE